MLTTFAKTATWKEKISISKQLLEAALTFTFDHPKFSFYFTDISADNFAISKEGRLKFIDMDDVIIVDKNPTVISSCWNKIHSSKMYDPGLLSFSVQEICSHNISDHNIYAVCQEILGKTSPLILGGLLHSSSEEMRTKFAKLLDACIQGPNRFEAANELLKVFRSEM
uniref:FAM69 protein-kinase domain-containing protein n=2 Tax=Clastoptera arizonana TaxID=38151 RepID=A0A1B6DKK0_9HEMI